MRQWRIPHYQYHKNVDLGELLEQFFDANENDFIGVAHTLGVSLKLLQNHWCLGEMTNGLVTTKKVAFERLTGIDVEQLMVIASIQRIQRMLETIEHVRKENPVLARMLERDPQLAKKLDCISWRTRDDIVKELRHHTDQAGKSPIALQLDVPDTLLSRWLAGNYRPSDDSLDRLIIGLSSGLHASDHDSARYQVAAEAIFGSEFAELLGANTFSEAIDRAFEDLRDLALSVIENQTGLKAGVVKTLLRYDAASRPSIQTILHVMRVIVHKRFSKAIARQFDEKATVFVTQCPPNSPFSIEPLNLSSTSSLQTIDEELKEEDGQEQGAGHEDPDLQELQNSALRENVSSTSEVTSAFAFPTAQVRALASTLLIARSSLDAQISALSMQFPNLFPQQSPPTHVAPVAKDHQPTVQQNDNIDGFIAGKSAHVDQKRINDITNSVTHICALVKRITQLPRAERAMVLRAIDPELVQFQTLIESAGVEEPAQYLKRLEDSRSARDFFALKNQTDDR